MESLQNGPAERYQQDLLKPDFTPDAAQKMAVDELQRLFDDMCTQVPARAMDQGWLGRAKQRLAAPQKTSTIRGVYLWGGVGRGKTYLMDVFFDTLPGDRKMRVHFHRFMRRVHKELQVFEGQKNPLQRVASRLAAEVDIICFDEFFVSDITDAMLLGGLFELLFEAHGIVLVATSNIVPDLLYKDGLQRQRFLPAIKLLNEHTCVLNVDGGVDYRLRTLEQAELYHFPLDARADVQMRQSFDKLAPEPGVAGKKVEVEGRFLNAVCWADDVVWFTFAELCDGPRSQNDYIELAKEYHAVLLSDIPALASGSDDSARRFINLVDEFYDRQVKLVITAALPIADLYSGNRLSFEFQRTASRLLEMQSKEYLAREHRP